jgi:fumarate hydratase subunit alpha
MREIQAQDITKAVAVLAQKANFELREDVLAALEQAREKEKSPQGCDVLDKIMENARIARKEKMPLCQDCGVAVVFLEIGQDLHISGVRLDEAVAEGVRQGYQQGYLRKSIVARPFSTRVNTGDNTPPVIHSEVVPGDKLKISFMPKGGGAENMSRLVMLKPGAGEQGIIEAVMAAVKEASGSPCPPLVIGLGIGATAEKAMLMAKKVLLRPVGYPSPDTEVAGLEKKILEVVNKLGIGPLGFGGNTTALAVHAESKPCHFASLPLAINMQCHSARHAEVIL